MHRFEMKSVLCGLALVTALARSASAVVLFDSHGFEASANPTINYVANSSLFGQPAGGLPQNSWSGNVTPDANNVYPVTGVFPYALPTNNNLQYALLQDNNMGPTANGYYYPKTNLSVTDGGFGHYTPLPNESIAVTFSMNVYAGYASNAFFGVTAFNGSGDQIASVGINNSTGALAVPAGTTFYNGGFTTDLGTFRGYELLLNYATQTFSVFTDPLTGPGAGTFTLRAMGTFGNASTDFSDADLASFSLNPTGTQNATGYAAFDDYLVQTIVPEPASIAVASLACGLLTKRRRHMV